jgi:hypothetical protein
VKGLCVWSGVFLSEQVLSFLLIILGSAGPTKVRDEVFELEQNLLGERVCSGATHGEVEGARYRFAHHFKYCPANAARSCEPNVRKRGSHPSQIPEGLSSGDKHTSWDDGSSAGNGT